MAILVLAHRDPGGEPIIINFDHILYAESQYKGTGTVIKWANGETLNIKEPLDFLHAKIAP